MTDDAVIGEHKHRRITGTHPPVVYVIGVDPDGPVKIGRTSNLSQRLDGLQIGNSEFLRPFAVRFGLFRRTNGPDPWSSLRSSLEEGASRLEEAAHRQLKEFGLRVRGEWFDLTAAEAVQFLDKLGEKGDSAAVSVEALAGVEWTTDPSVEAVRKKMLKWLMRPHKLCHNCADYAARWELTSEEKNGNQKIIGPHP